MNNKIINKIYKQTGYTQKQISNVINLLDEKNTIPFIARYRKDFTNNLDEIAIKEISDQYDFLLRLNTRRDEIINTLTKSEKLTKAIENDLSKAETLSELEDIYRPFKVKRKTLASKAKEMGLEPLAHLILKQADNVNIEKAALEYVNDELDQTAVIMGAIEIIAEYIGDLSELRKFFRTYIYNNGILKTKLKTNADDENATYKMYYDFSEKLTALASHRTLAINRAEKADILTVNIEIDNDEALRILEKRLITNLNSDSYKYIQTAANEAFKRFIKPAIEREIRNEISEAAQENAAKVFSENLYNLLLAKPLKNQIIMGFDPAFKSGCKLAIINEHGEVLKIDIIYPHATSNANQEKAALDFINLINTYKVDLVALGNGTASRESEIFIAENLKKVNHKVKYLIVSEAGASVYSASEIARQEFPNLQVEERSAISIARRVLDPLAELVKIDPKAIGVGQYQHDITPKVLDDNLAFVVEHAVNQVGVDLNSASEKLLEFISGLNKSTAKNIVKYRSANKRFTNRKQLLEVARLGAKSYEQAVGFLRIYDGDNILDTTKIHPESYPITRQLIADYQLDFNNLESQENAAILNSLDIDKLSEKYQVGSETLLDIINELKTPAIDIRDQQASVKLHSDVLKIEDLKVGVRLNGTVRNVVDFGAFVDIGLDNDGLVHISKISKQFVKHPSEILKVGQQVEVVVIDFDANTKRISLSMID